ncbi:hypothetical protein GZH53_09970 [Flavihumibacter sp. R14]|nr:hypothetical protein [Flavihumibacter soli]
MELLKNGSAGSLVVFLQRKLVQLNYNLSLTGEFDEPTLQAVTDFQTKSGLTGDGIVGGKTWTQVYLGTEKARTATGRLDRHNNIMHLHPTVRTAAVKVVMQLQSENIPFKIFEAYRYPQRQADLYAQGRTKPGRKVTFAKPWSSYHQYGLAADFVLLINGNWSWDASGNNKFLWQRLHEIGANEGLMRLNFELPHLQLAGTSINALREGEYPPKSDKSWFDNLTSAIGV